jgi:hypothetical protein
MGRARSWRWCVCLLAGALWLVVAGPLAAASFVLTPRERDEAVRFGKRSVVGEDFGAEWRVTDGPGQLVVVMTPFHRLALAARNSAFRNQELRPREIESLLKEHQGKLVLWVTLRGGRPDFARFYAPVLVAGWQEIKPEFVQNERTALREEDGRYTARCLYVFPADGLDPKARVALVVRDADERPTAQFTVDLSAMR